MSKLLDLFNSGVNKSVKNETNFSLEIYYRDNYNILNTPNIINLNEIYNKNITENRSFYIDDKIPEQNNLVKIYNQNFSLSNGISDIGGLLTGNITFPRPDAKFLLEIKNGLYTYDELSDYLESFDEKFNDLYEKSTLPHSPDKPKIDELCRRIVKRFLLSS